MEMHHDSLYLLVPCEITAVKATGGHNYYSVVPPTTRARVTGDVRCRAMENVGGGSEEGGPPGPSDRQPLRSRSAAKCHRRWQPSPSRFLMCCKIFQGRLQFLQTHDEPVLKAPVFCRARSLGPMNSGSPSSWNCPDCGIGALELQIFLYHAICPAAHPNDNVLRFPETATYPPSSGPHLLSWPDLISSCRSRSASQVAVSLN